MIEQFKKIEETVLNFINRNSAKIVGALAVLVFLGIMNTVIRDTYNRPENTAEFAKTSVMLVDKMHRSGGSGVILTSNLSYSEVLTNKHVCKLLEGGGYVVKDGLSKKVSAIKKYPKHDLCLVKVHYNFGINTKVLSRRLRPYEDATISGHPGLMPHAVTKGNFSGREIITLVVGFRECTDKDNPMICALFWGKFPVVQEFNSQLVTGIILPGSSGSGVFSKSGEIAGVVFAGRSNGFSYAYIVPQEYIVDFVSNKKHYRYVSVNRTRYNKLIRRIFSVEQKCAEAKENVTKQFCGERQGYIIWTL